MNGIGLESLKVVAHRGSVFLRRRDQGLSVHEYRPALGGF